MKKHLMLIAVVGAAILAPAAYAGDADTSAPAPTTKVSKEEKKAAAEARKKAGVEARKTEKVGEGAAGAASTAKVSKEEKKAAAAKRKAEVADAAKKGELPKTGEK